MTMIDENQLTSALRAEGDAFTISAGAIERILDAAEGEEGVAPRHYIPSAVREPGRPRMILIAAAAILVAGAIAIPLFRGETPTNSNLNAQKRAPSGLLSGGEKSLSASPPLTPTTVNGQSAVTATGFAEAGASKVASPQRIESTGTVALVVAKGDVETAFSKLASLVARDHGLVDSSEANVGSHASGRFASGTIVLQVPQTSFALLVAQVQHVGHATSVSTTSNNVTSQYVDLQARISALAASRTQYLKIITRATTISDILAVQNQINNIQSQIEQYQGQLKVLNNETTYGSLTVNVNQKGHSSTPGHRTGFAKAWHDSVEGFVSGFEWIVRLAGPVLFAALALGALYEIAKFSRRGLRRRRM